MPLRVETDDLQETVDSVSENRDLGIHMLNCGP